MKFKIDDVVRFKDPEGAAFETGYEVEYFKEEFSIVDFTSEDEYPYCVQSDSFFVLWAAENEIELVQ